ncbi:MAG TPA: ABC transporter ATP-binding protein [Candidatus Intestinimonas stercoravium]|uniref:ABC transporter ATP-binding protein n=1 Tax=uncultured Intestinimonas sp. TaxID=1689265 RepID=UPI001F8CD5DE|nr:ABC transporter ATP-binding protein [uncultured Intestinimonas sp.]HJA63728.1 ABC transporter ATP-binding protein [Candidatus Intestinimonas stercoravium]
MGLILSVSHLEKVYGGRGSRTKALSDLSFQVEQGGFTGIMGASGSGKTTLLNCIATIDRPTSGSITVEGTEITRMKGKALSRFRRERLGFIFQDCDLLDTLTGLENIALALTIQGARPGEVERRARETAALLGLEGVLDKYPYQMSGGEQQRVAAARAIVGRPALVLADEPTGALDSRAAGQLLRQLSWLNREQGTTILMVTHDAFTASWCRRILFIQDGALFRELRREDREDRRTFFARILGVVGALGGDAADVL